MTDLTPAALDPNGLTAAEKALNASCHPWEGASYDLSAAIRAYLSAATPSPAPDDEALCAELEHQQAEVVLSVADRAAARLRSMAGECNQFAHDKRIADKWTAEAIARAEAAEAQVKAMGEARDAIDAEHAKVSGDDGYNYKAGQEYGLRLALIIIDRARRATGGKDAAE